MTDEQLEKIFNATPGIGHERLFAAMRAAIEVEREACAEICDGFTDLQDAAFRLGMTTTNGELAEKCANDIRKRSCEKILT